MNQTQSFSFATPLLWLGLGLCLIPPALHAQTGNTDGTTAAGGAAASTELRWPNPWLFPLPQKLEPNVAFWTKVYTGCNSKQVLLHDDLHLDVIYTLLDFTEIEAQEISDVRKQQLRREEVEKTKNRYAAALRGLAAGRPGGAESALYEHVEKLLEKVPGGRGKYTAALGRMRTQTCLQDRFSAGIERSGAYMTHIEQTFSARSLPVELTRLPFVESLFQLEARSSASAGGIWQFVPGTARFYLRMGAEFDERFDPLRATEAAAQHLAADFRDLGSWPVAITAYNHGGGGMKRAIRTLGTTDIGEIATRYQSRSFGFASRNFYSEFLAAYVAYENRDRFFPGLAPHPPLEFEEFVAEHYLPLDELARSAGAELERLQALNPALSRQLWSGDLLLPKNYRLRVPTGQLAAFKTAYTALPEERKLEHQTGHRYQVRNGDTLGKIAVRYGTTVAAIQSANRLASPNRLRIGQTLLIPPRRSSAPAATQHKGS